MTLRQTKAIVALVSEPTKKAAVENIDSIMLTDRCLQKSIHTKVIPFYPSKSTVVFVGTVARVDTVGIVARNCNSTDKKKNNQRYQRYQRNQRATMSPVLKTVRVRCLSNSLPFIVGHNRK